MGYSLKLLLILVTFMVPGSAEEAQFSVVRREKIRDFSSALSDHRIKELVTSTLGIDLADGTYSDVGVTTHDGYLVVHLFGNNYSTERVRLQKAPSGSYSVVRNYVYVPEDQSPCLTGTCPDESIRVVCSGSFNNPGHISRVKVKEAYDQITAAGIKAKHLGGSQENREAIMNWLACKKLILWCRIGHGSQNSIDFAGAYAAGNLTPKDIASNDLRGKIFILNAPHTPQFTNPLLKAGLKFYCGNAGIDWLLNGTEKAWLSIVSGAAKDKKELNALVDATNETQGKKLFGKSGENPAYYEEINR